MEQPPRKDSGTAQKRREQARRATARKVSWLSDLLRSSASHHTAHGGGGGGSHKLVGSLCPGCSVLSRRLISLEQRLLDFEKVAPQVFAAHGSDQGVSAVVGDFKKEAGGQVSPQEVTVVTLEPPSLTKLKADYKAKFGQEADAEDSGTEEDGEPEMMRYNAKESEVLDKSETELTTKDQEVGKVQDVRHNAKESKNLDKSETEPLVKDQDVKYKAKESKDLHKSETGRQQKLASFEGKEFVDERYDDKEVKNLDKSETGLEKDQDLRYNAKESKDLDKAETGRLQKLADFEGKKIVSTMRSDVKLEGAQPDEDYEVEWAFAGRHRIRHLVRGWRAVKESKNFE